MKKYLSLAAIPLIAGCAANQKTAKKQANTKPNIVFIYADDLGYGDLSCYGSDSISTPALDKLAEGGIRFTSFYSTASVSTPSRAGLLTGKYQVRSGMHKLQFPWSKSGMPPEEFTMAEMFKKKGYATGMVGKWHLGHKPGSQPNDNGFDYFFGLHFSNDMKVRISPAYKNVKEELALRRNQTIINQPVFQPTLTQRYSSECQNFIARHQNEPFFLYMAHTFPHEPLYASAEFKGSSKYGLYGDVVQELDHAVGELVETLDYYGLLENTLIVFSSDNGARMIPQRFGNHEPCGSNGELRGAKATCFEGGVRVPTIAFWKGKIAPGQVIDQPAMMFDWYPTFAELIDYEIAEHQIIDGEDLAPVLFDNGTREGEEFYFFAKDKDTLEAIRVGDWKLKKATSYSKSLSHYSHSKDLLFNIKKDPNEKNNLIGQFPEKAKALRAKMDAFEKEVKK